MLARNVSQVLVVALLLGGSSAKAQNLLINPDFNRSVLGWTAPAGATLTWSSSDSDTDFGFGARLSGSARATIPANSFISFRFYQCLANPFPGAATGRNVKIGGEVRRIPPNSDGAVGMGLDTFSTSDCSGAPTLNVINLFEFPGESWTQLKGAGTLPNNVGSFLFWFDGFWGWGSDFNVEFDQLYLLDCDTARFDLNNDDASNATDLVIGANHLVGNIGCLPTQ